jgi:hypothetical protein
MQPHSSKARSAACVIKSASWFGPAVHKYAQSQPVQLHSTPLEQRIERAEAAEKRAVLRAKQLGALTRSAQLL